TARALEEADGPRQRLVIVVRDHGEPSHSATATLSVSLVEGGEAALSGAGSSSSLVPSVLSVAEGGLSAGVASATANVWLVVAICSVSSLLLLALVLYGAARCSPRAAVLSGAAPATLVCASEVGSWSYSQRQSRSLCVAEGAGKSDLMVFSPNLPPPPAVPAATDTSQPEPSSMLDTVSGPTFRASFLLSLFSFFLPPPKPETPSLFLSLPPEGAAGSRAEPWRSACSGCLARG
ncbi:protocadherin alpha-10-like, partial [Melanerpes formicivorus]|uniref:protocadherin alpha-10-like n=1 Tax=Melanerpes formicivorus TaxID=211600 RepID=UPI00358F40B8